MAKVRLTIRGQLGEISAGAFVSSIDNTLWILRDLDRRVSTQRFGTLKWVVSGLGTGGNGYLEDGYLELESRVIRGRVDFGPRINNLYADGLDMITHQRSTPPYFSTDTLEHVVKMIREFRRNGVQGLDVLALDTNKRGGITSKESDTLQELVGVHHKSIGSVEGKIELVSVHKPYRKFNIYHPITQKAIRCNFPREIEPDVWRGAEEGLRVIVSGIVSYNIRGEPISIVIQRPIRFLKDEKSLPTIEDLLGAATDITGNQSTEDYIRSLRDAE